ncbi:MAG: glutamate racemase [Firmicutes bacterium]|nr:glutamate racemase [Bacillota bacterium]
MGVTTGRHNPGFSGARDKPEQAIGIFDSGVGGLSVAKEIRALLPGEDLFYFADSRYCQYGEKTPDFIRERAFAITGFLLARGCKMIVVACNTASEAALGALRDAFPAVPFVGVEPAVKQAAAYTKKQRVGVLATALTLAGNRFSALVEKFAGGLTVVTQPSPGLVEAVEAGKLETEETEALLKTYLQPLLEHDVDVIVLGCTHYPFLRPLVEKIVGPEVKILDTGKPVARQVMRVLERRGLLSSRQEGGEESFFTSGLPERVAPVLRRLWPRPVREVIPVD